MFFNMKLNYLKIFDIKCILAEVSKKQLANDLGISQMTLSRDIKDKNIIESINTYFDEIDPEINQICYKLLETSQKPVYKMNDKVENLEDPKSEFQKKYIETLEKLQRSQEIRLKYLEEERKRFIDKFGPIYD